ncbi:MAG TPA: hypothetical protein VKE93_11865, partial [Candidatus Angelobacter sp.]|nr:hypothetical protein [Candidatus Angelobacter sp.]
LRPTITPTTTANQDGGGFQYGGAVAHHLFGQSRRDGKYEVALRRNSIDLLRATDFRDGAFLCKLAVCETPI